MASKTTTAISAALLVASLILLAAPVSTDAQSPMAAPGPFSSPLAPSSGSDDCINNLLNMSDCLTYVESGSNLTKPDKGCCPELAGLIESHPICLCQLLANPEKIIGVQIELKKALKLPSVCKIDSPSASLCSAFGIPVGAPAPSEGTMAPSAGHAAADAMSPVGGAAASSPSSPGKDGENAAMAVFGHQWHFLLGLPAIVFAILFF